MTFLYLHCEAQIQVDLVANKNQIRLVKVSGATQTDTLAVYKLGGSRAILGSWEYKQEIHFFRPVLSLSAGIDYIVYRNDRPTHSFKLPKEDVIAPTITAFFPSADTVPENLLKCYVQFSKPMREKDLYSYITVSDGQGKEVREVILPLEPALWNEDRTMLTFWIDPGRVKRGLKRNRRLGAPITEGESYTFAISENWQSADGAPLGTPWQKTFYVAARTEKLAEPQNWQVIPPKTGTTDPLTMIFPQNMDYLTTLSGFTILKDGIAQKGTAEMGNGEKRWLFQPSKPWVTGTYTIEITPSIEDLAGNSLLRPFDRDLQKQEAASKPASHQLSFTITGE